MEMGMGIGTTEWPFCAEAATWLLVEMSFSAALHVNFRGERFGLAVNGLKRESIKTAIIL
jgi:hypothetical protein